jgi:excisionase family DNA binding protein
MTTEEAAKYLGIDESMVRRYCRQEKISAIKVGRDWLIEKAALDSFEPQPRGRAPKDD